MRSILTLTLVNLIFSFSASAQNLSVLFNSKQFNLIDQNSTLVENYLNIAPHSVVFKNNAENKRQANIEITQLFRIDDSIINYKKYILHSLTIGSDSIAEDILDQQRFTLKPGKYTYEISLKDLNAASDSSFYFSDDVDVADFNSKLGFSDVEFIESYSQAKEVTEFTKSGFTILPMVQNHFSNDYLKLAYYTELYNSDKVGESFLLVQFIEDYETTKRLNKYAKMKKIKGAAVVPELNVFDISELPSGKYNLVLQLKDINNTTIAENKTFFTRENPTKFDINNYLAANITNSFISNVPDSLLGKYISSLAPIASNLESNIIKKADSLDIDLQQRFFYSFWKERNSESPGTEWEKYKIEVNKAEKLFSTQIKHGYETDRGRIFLKYGPPNTQTARLNEVNSYPYEIWHYYKIDKFNNKKFIFYQPDLITNDFELLHSDYPGERRNQRWKIDLQKRNTPFNSVDDTNSNNSTWGNQQDDLFTNPR